MRKIYRVRTGMYIISLSILLIINGNSFAQEKGNVFQSRGVPANPNAKTEYIQPDGSAITITMNGDAVVNWATTSDGYTLLMNENNGFEYAIQSKNDGLVPSGILAQNPEDRSEDALSFLVNIKPGLLYSKDQVIAKKENHLFFANKDKSASAFPTTGTRNYIVILANFSNTSTTYSQSNFDNYMNQVNYNGTGSFKDYYLENSYGQLILTTTVTIWVTLPQTHDYYGPDTKWGEFAYQSVVAADPYVNYANFDNDGDGTVDGIGIIHQGRGQEESGNTLDIWSHSWDLASAGYSSSQRTFDGVYTYSYTTQPELANSSGAMGNIGVMCHEFGHTLGAPDFYDTDYNTGGYYSGTGSWDCMAGGSWNNSGKTPAHHNGFTKWFYYGWLTPITINSAATISMSNIEQNQVLYRYTTTTSNEYYLLENRQQTGFDASLPGHGLIIYHADQNYIITHDGSNDINATSHQGLYPKAAGGTINASSCPFPGTTSNTSFTDLTTPNSKSWAGANTNKPVTNIAEVSQTITFDFMGGASTPPLADFLANNTNPLNTVTTVNFSNLTTGTTPITYLWSFSPATVSYMGGTNANSANPQVRFNSPGAYTVSLYAQNANGNDTELKTDYIHVGSPGVWTGGASGNPTDWNTAANWENHTVPTSSTDVSILPTATFWPTKNGNLTIGSDCNSLNMASGYTELNVSGDLSILNGKSFYVDPTGIPSIKVGGNWTNNGTFNEGLGTIEFNGTTAGSISASTNYLGGGKIDNSGGGGYYGSPTYVIFDCYSAFSIISVKVYAIGAGNRTFYWANSSGTVQELTVNVPSGESRVTLNFNITAGTQHRLGISSSAPNLYRNNFGVSYPYAIGTVGSLINSNAGTSYYYFCYDIEFSTGSGAETFNNLVVSKVSSPVSTNGDITVNNDFTVKPGAQFTNSSGNIFNITGNSTFESDASGMASFIDDGTTTFGNPPNVQQYLTNDKWHFTSIPVTGAQSGVYTGIYLRTFNEPTDSWNSYITGTIVPLDNTMMGYAAWAAGSPATVLFNGPLKNGAYSIPVTNQSSGSDAGWNLVGNPYPSSLDWDASGWTKTNVNNTIYYYSGASGVSNYKYYIGSGGETPGTGIGANNGTNEIPPQQGFFIHVNSGFTSGTLGVSNSERIHSGQSYYKKEDSDYPIIRIVAEGNGLNDETVIRFLEDSNIEFDGDLDAYKLFANDYPQVYTKTPSGTELAISSLPEITEELVIPVLFSAPSEDTYSFTFTELIGFDKEGDLYLEDLLVNKTIEVEENTVYEFEYSSVNVNDRFLLHFNNPLDVENTTSNQKINIYSYNNVVYIQKPINFNGDVFIYDILGKEVINTKAQGEGLMSIPVINGSGYYVVKVTSDKLVRTKKVYIR